MAYKNQAVQREYQREWMKRRREGWLADKICVDCGSSEDLEIDHDEPKNKISHRIWSWSKDRRERELQKCKVRCRICHSRKSHKENVARDIWKSKRKYADDGKTTCSGCGESLPVTMFSKDKHNCNGLYSCCKKCRSLRRNKKSLSTRGPMDGHRTTNPEA